MCIKTKNKNNPRRVPWGPPPGRALEDDLAPLYRTTILLLVKKAITILSNQLGHPIPNDSWFESTKLINSIIYLNCQTFPLKSQKQFSSNFFIWHLNNLWNLISGYYLQNNKLGWRSVQLFQHSTIESIAITFESEKH